LRGKAAKNTAIWEFWRKKLDPDKSRVYNSLGIMSTYNPCYTIPTRYEVIIINKQSYMAELSKLLGFMSAWDRRDTLQKYDALFDEAPDTEEFIASVGSPTKLAISLAANYVPSPPPASIPVDPEEAEEAEHLAEENTEIAPVEGEETALYQEEEEAIEKVPSQPAKRVRFFGLLFSFIFTLVIGIPVALMLICIGLPFIVGGLGLGAGIVWAALAAIPMLTLFSDILAFLGAGLVLLAIALLLFWFGLWLSFELGYLWIGGVVLRLGRALTYKKEVAAE